MTPQQMRRRFFLVLALAIVAMLAVGAKLMVDEIERIEAVKAGGR